MLINFHKLSGTRGLFVSEFRALWSQLLVRSFCSARTRVRGDRYDITSKRSFYYQTYILSQIGDLNQLDVNSDSQKYSNTILLSALSDTSMNDMKVLLSFRVFFYLFLHVFIYQHIYPSDRPASSSSRPSRTQSFGRADAGSKSSTAPKKQRRSSVGQRLPSSSESPSKSVMNISAHAKGILFLYAWNKSVHCNWGCGGREKRGGGCLDPQYIGNWNKDRWTITKIYKLHVENHQQLYYFSIRLMCLKQPKGIGCL